MSQTLILLAGNFDLNFPPALPQAPTNVRVSDVQPTSVRLSWSYDGDVSSDVQYYVIQYKPKAATWDYKEISGAITNFYDIRGLRYV